MIQDDRPIKPSEQYLQNLNKPTDRIVVNQNNYLRRSSGKYLPCFSQTKLKLTNPLGQSPRNQPTKRQIYERIRSENQAMYGKQKKKKQQTQIQKIAVQTEQLKKQKAKRMELSLVGKERVIETDQEKVIPPLKRVQPKALTQTSTNKQQKQKYQRLIKQMQKQRELLKKQREQFQEQKLLLEFRKNIKNEQGIRPKNSLRDNKSSQYYHHKSKQGFFQSVNRKQTKNVNSNSKLNESKMSEIDKTKSLSKRRDFKSDLVESKKLIQNISQKIIQIQSNQKLISQKHQFHNSKNSNPKLQLQNLPSLNNFSIDIFTNQNEQILVHTNNKYYRQFLNRQKTLKVLSKHKQGNKQITKYQDGSFTKDNKKCRLVQFPSGYRLTIFQNHDVKQEMPDGMVCYYSRAKDVNKIYYNTNFDIYYFYKEKQIEVHYKPSGRKEIKYRNGIKRTVVDPDV